VFEKILGDRKLKNILLCADGDLMVYAVPSEVADNLEKYCYEFCSEWLWKNPHAAKYRTDLGVCYNEADFIEYLNKWVFPQKQAVFIENLGKVNDKDLPRKYKDCPSFYF